MEATAVYSPAIWSEAAQLEQSPMHYNTQQTIQEGATFVTVAPTREGLGEMSDEYLMLAVGMADTHALEELYDRHVKGCFGLAMKIVRDPLVAEEVVQDVFMKLWSRPHSFSAERGKFSSWLLTLVHNRSIDKLRRTQSGIKGMTIPITTDSATGLDIAGTLPDTAPGPDDIAWANERGQIVRDALAKLNEPQRQTIMLAYFDGLTQVEIAEKLHQPLGTVKTRTRSAMRQLRHLLDMPHLLGDTR
jgi:RNA polymerase sigma factor (sigma-70 family)